MKISTNIRYCGSGKWFTLASAVVFALTLVLGSFTCAVAEGPIAGRLKTGQAIRHAIANDSPWGYLDSAGKPVGIEVELSRVVLSQMGIKNPELIYTTFGALIPGIKAGRFDMASDGIYIRPARCKEVAFSYPHVMLGVGTVMLKSHPRKPHSIEELVRDKTLRIGMTTGGAQDREFRLAGGNPEQLIDFPDRAPLVAALKSKRIDVGIFTSLGAIGLVNALNDPDIELVQPFKQLYIEGKLQVSYSAFAFSHDDKAFVEKFNKELIKVIFSPTYKEILARYKIPNDFIPIPDVNVDELCK